MSSARNPEMGRPTKAKLCKINWRPTSTHCSIDCHVSSQKIFAAYTFQTPPFSTIEKGLISYCGEDMHSHGITSSSLAGRESRSECASLRGRSCLATSDSLQITCLSSSRVGPASQSIGFHMLGTEEDALPRSLTATVGLGPVVKVLHFTSVCLVAKLAAKT